MTTLSAHPATKGKISLTTFLTSRARPCSSYEEALERIERLTRADTSDVNPAGYSRFLSHGGRTERAIVFLHGLTSSPQQFHQLGYVFYELGYNVLIPRLPRHGLKNRMTTEHGKLTATELVRAADEAVDIGCGLGHHVTVAGLSLGGVLSAWIAQHRCEVGLAAPIAPAFAGLRLPYVLNTALGKLMLRLPNFFIWWDPIRKDRRAPYHGYPRFSTHALGHVFRIGREVYVQSISAPPAARRVIMIYSRKDPVVNHAPATAIVDRWRLNGAQCVQLYDLGDELPVLHDIIDPEQKRQRIDIVYPRLVELIHGDR